MPKILFKRGQKSTMPKLDFREPAITDDTEEIFVGGNTQNIQLAKQTDLDTANTNIASKANQSDLDTTNTNVGQKADKTYVDTQLGYKANQSDLDTTNQNVDSLTVSLAQIAINLKSFGAKGDGVTDDTTAIMSCINYADANGVKEILIPVGTYKISSTIDLTGKLYNCVINGHGATFKADGIMTTPMMILNGGGHSDKSRLIKIYGLTFDGNYKAIGLYINSAHEWSLFGISFNCCTVGLRLESTYYGVIGQECIFFCCMIGIDFYRSNPTTGEVNAIGMENIKFYGPNSSQKTLFGTSNPSIAVNLGSNMIDIDFYKFTFEWWDYGFYGFNLNSGGGAVAHPVFNISSCYFEQIVISPIYLDNVGTDIVMPICKISNCSRQASGPVQLATGQWEYTQNDYSRDSSLILKSRVDTVNACTLITDIPISNITNQLSANIMRIIRNKAMPTSMNGYYNPLSSVGNSFPNSFNTLQTLEDNDYQESFGYTSGNVIRNRYVKQSFTKPLAFVDKKAFPIIRGADKNYYALTTNDGTSLVLKKILNNILFETPSNYLYAKELYFRTDWTEGQQMGCIETGALYTYHSGKWTDTLSGLTYTAIGKGSELNQFPNAYSGSKKAFNIETDMVIGSTPFWWGQCDIGGNWSGVPCVGHAADKPANGTGSYNGFSFYNLDNNLYYVWNSTYYMTKWIATTAYAQNDYIYVNNKIYQCTVAGTTGSTAPSHSSGTATDGGVTWTYIGALTIDVPTYL